MASYTINRAAGEFAAHAKTLAPGVADSVTFGGSAPGGLGLRFRVIVHPSADNTPIYVSVDGAATVAGAKCRPVWPGTSLELSGDLPDPAVASLISAAALTYSVEA